MSRLDTQRQPVRGHIRKSSRWYIRGYDTLPAAPWGDVAQADQVAPPATGATAGSPGTWTPSGSRPPANAAGATGITASPTTAWTTGQYVQGTTAGAPGEMTWSGTAWVGGRAP